MVFLTKMNGYQKMCDTNKNVTNMRMIIKGVYCILMCLSYEIIKYVFTNYKVNNHNKFFLYFLIIFMSIWVLKSVEKLMCPNECQYDRRQKNHL
jgi:hypothetical protein